MRDTVDTVDTVLSPALLDTLWGKSSRENKGSRKWLPLITHLTDAMETAAALWDTYLPEQVTRNLIEQCSGDAQQARRVYLFLAGAHDVGKASPHFIMQCEWLASRVESAVPELPCRAPERFEHARTGHTAFYRWLYTRAGAESLLPSPRPRRVDYGLGWGIPILAHHGRFPPTDNGSSFFPLFLKTASRHRYDGVHQQEWRDVQHALLDRIADCVGLMHEDIRLMVSAPLSPTNQVLLTGAVMMADWIASDVSLFPLFDVSASEAIPDSDRSESALARLALPDRWKAGSGLWDDFESCFVSRFSRTPRPVQRAVFDHLKSHAPESGSMLVVIEDATGSGKTEAGLAAAEMLAHRSGARGVLMALPTRATSDAQFGRMAGWVDNLSRINGQRLSLALVHGHAAFNTEAAELTRVGLFSDTRESSVGDLGDDCGAVTHRWMAGKHRSVMHDFVVTTIDAVLALSLREKLIALPHLAVASKVVILDEVHASDDYMRALLCRTLRWLGEHGVPVIALSATLNPAVRAELHAAYRGQDSATPDTDAGVGTDDAHRRSFPIISSSARGGIAVAVTDGIPVSGHSKTVRVRRLPGETVSDIGEAIAARVRGGCVAVVCNTVSGAQRMYADLARRLPDWTVELMHSRFTVSDRRQRESALLSRLGPDGDRPEKLMVVGTQVLEQSLDIDFDVMFSDLAPMDSLLQRMGRLHRHPRNDRSSHHPEPVLYLTGILGGSAEEPPRFPAGWKAVYRGTAYLLASAAELVFGERRAVTTPDDTPALMLPLAEVKVPEPWQDEYIRALVELDARVVADVSKAQGWLVGAPDRNANYLDGWNYVETGNTGAEFPQVRNSVMSESVLVLERGSNGYLYVPATDEHPRIRVASTLVRIADPALSEDDAVRLAMQSVPLPYGQWAALSALPTTGDLRSAGYAPRWKPTDRRLGIDKDTKFLIVESDTQEYRCPATGKCFRYSNNHGLEIE
jgi:CRISPR-associated helicase Cas3/CRISPR-associated endonuclease Cas3-HD